MNHFSVQPDRTLIRAGASSTRHVLVSFTAPEAPRSASRQDVNVAFVIDRSGSMGGQKIELARAAVVQALQMLRPGDRFAVIGYDHEVDVVVPSTEVSSEAVRNAIERVSALQARGNTDLCGGWLRGCEQIARHLAPGQIGRCILLTDGLANHGVTDHDVLAQHARELRDRGVKTSTIGVGADFDERLLQALADNGDGHFYFVQSAIQIPDYLTSELGEALETVARDVTIRVRAEGVEVDTLNRFPIAREGQETVLRLGDLVSRQDVSLVFRLVFPQGREGSTLRAIVSVQDAASVLQFPETDAVWTYRDHAANDAQPRNVVVDRAVAQLYAAKAQAEALELNRAGRFDRAEGVLQAVRRRVAQYAGSDPELQGIVAGLAERQRKYGVRLGAVDMKAEHFASASLARNRDPQGKARRK